jgi:O-antigen/teichoic acid export membrane protein
MLNIASVTRNSLILILSNVLSLVLAFAVSLVLARSLGDATYGTYIFIMSAVSIGAGLSELGLNRISTREVARDLDNAGTVIFTAIVLRVVASFLVLAPLAAFLVLSARFQVGLYSVVFVAAVVIVQRLGDLMRSVPVGRERMEWDAASGVAGGLVTLVVCLAMATYQATLLWMIAGVAIGGLTRLLILGFAALHLLPKARSGFSLAHARFLVKSGILLGLSSLVLSFYTRVDVLVIRLFREPSEVAWFSVPYTLLVTLVSASSAFALALFPSFSRLSQHDRAAFQQVVARAVRYMIIAAYALAATLFLGSEWLILAFYGAEYAPAVVAIRILAPALLFMFPTQILAFALIADDRQNWAALVNITGIVVNVALDFLLIPRIGYRGAAAANLVTEMLVLSVDAYLVHRAVGGSILTEFLRPTAAALLAGVVGILCWTYLGPFASGALGCAAYLIGLFAVGALSREDINLLRAGLKV